MQIQVVLVLWCTGAAGTGAPLLVQVSVVLSGRQVVGGALARVVLPYQCNVQLLKSNGCEWILSGATNGFGALQRDFHRACGRYMK